MSSSSFPSFSIFEEFKLKIASINTASAKLVTSIFPEIDSDGNMSEEAKKIFTNKIKDTHDTEQRVSLIFSLGAFTIIFLTEASGNKVISSYHYLINLLETDRLINFSFKEIIAISQIYNIHDKVLSHMKLYQIKDSQIEEFQNETSSPKIKMVFLIFLIIEVLSNYTKTALAKNKKVLSEDPLNKCNDDIPINQPEIKLSRKRKNSFV